MSSTSVQIDLRGLRARRQEILGCATDHGARNVRVFGSVVRGEVGVLGDVDLLVEMEPGRSSIFSYTEDGSDPRWYLWH